MNLNEIAELAHSQIFPNSGDEAAIDVVDFQRTAYAEYAYQMLLMVWKEKNDEGYFEIPGFLLTEVEKSIIDNEMDISDLKYFRSLPQEVWLSGIGGFGCECRYVKSTANLAQLLCNDDSLDDGTRVYYVLGKKIKFPLGVHKNTLTLTYANMGETVDGYIEVDEAIGAIVREKLNSVYLGKIAQADVTNNSNPNG